MGNRSAVLSLAMILIVASLGLTYYKWRVLGFPLWPDSETRTWTVELRLGFDAGPGPVKARLFIPGLTPGFALLDENFVSRGFGFDTRYVSGGREVEWTVRRATGRQNLYYRAVVYQDPSRQEDDTTPPFPPVPELAEPFQTAMEVVAAEVRDQSADPASFTVALLKRLNSPTPDQNVELLMGPEPTIVDKVSTAKTILAAARIPSRIMHGVLLEDRQNRAPMLPWLAVHDGDQWLYFDPDSAEAGRPNQFLVWWRGVDPLVKVDGARNVETRVLVRSGTTDPLIVARQRAEQQRSVFGSVSLFDLPLQTQSVYSVLLLIPLGALVVLFMRNVIGLQTFGTFMPVLIALAFRETQLLWGIVMFSMVVVIGLALRFYLERLRLLLVPRLASVLTIVVILLLLISVFSDRLAFDSGLSVALFPMVILAMTIERMSVVWEERGAGTAIRQGLGSLVVAATCYLVMGIDIAEHLLFVFPELLLLILALTVLMGRYTGYRLSELIRFRALDKPGTP